MKRPEQELHRSIYRYLRMVLPHGFIVDHQSNNPRSRVAGGIAKSMGAVKGWPDLQILGCEEIGGVIHARSWFLEIKALGGRVSPEQRDLHDHLMSMSHVVGVVHSIDETRAFLRKHLIPNKEAA